MNDAIVIRRARAGDLEPLIDILIEVTAEGRYLSTELPVDREQRRAHWEAQLRDENCAKFVALCADRPIGQISVAQHAEYGPLLGIFVAPAYRGRGVGRRLLDRAIDWTKSHGFATLSLLVFSHNDAAINLYERFGFEQADYYAGDVTRRNGDVWDTILMTKRLRDVSG